MSNTLIVTGEILKKIHEEKTLKFIKRKQKNMDSYNYYITPNLSIELFNPKVMIVTPKYIVFEYKKHEILNLFSLLQYTNNTILNIIKMYTRTDLKTTYNLYSEVDDNITIRCSLPQKNNKYLIDNIDMYTLEKRTFFLPKRDICINRVIIDIRNLWETNDKIGYNLELKSIKN